MGGYRFVCGVLLLLTICTTGCISGFGEWKSIEVTATAYNSVAEQTDGLPLLAAWGDTLTPDMKCIAVSHDLIEMGLGHNTEVKIEGLKGIYLVKDKMGNRHTKKIDIFMGKNVDSALSWGIQELNIRYRNPIYKIK